MIGKNVRGSVGKGGRCHRYFLTRWPNSLDIEEPSISSEDLFQRAFQFDDVITAVAEPTAKQVAETFEEILPFRHMDTKVIANQLAELLHAICRIPVLDE